MPLCRASFRLPPAPHLQRAAPALYRPGGLSDAVRLPPGAGYPRRLGLLVFTELPDWQHIGDAAWKDQACENVREMVLQYRNYPSSAKLKTTPREGGFQPADCLRSDKRFNFFRQSSSAIHSFFLGLPLTRVDGRPGHFVYRPQMPEHTDRTV